MGRHSGGDPRPYDNGSGAFGHAVLAFLAWWHKHLLEPLGDYFGKSVDRLWGIRRSRRWLICFALGILTLIIAGLVVSATVQGHKRDLAIVTTQGSDQGILVEEDHSACRMEIDLHGRTVDAKTSCNTASSFPAGTQVAVVRDPADPARFLVASPGQDWHEATPDDIWFGIVSGSVVALAMVWLGHHILLHPDRPGSPLDQEPPVLAAGTPEPQRGTAASAALDRFEETWESRKAAAGNGWVNFVEQDVRIRGTLLGALVIVVTGVAIALGSATHAEIAHDRMLAKTQPVVNTTLLDFGGRGENPTVRFGTTAIELDHGLRGEFFRDVGEIVAVVEDPQDPGRLIPAEFADSRGPWGSLFDAGPMAIAWMATIGFLGWLLIPRELAVLGKAIDNFIRGGRPGSRH